MQFVEPFRNSTLIKSVLQEIKRVVRHNWVIMEICGGQTHAIMRYGIDQLLPAEIELVHGPGCPVCVTSLELIDKALAIASMPGVIFASFGDMLRVPGSTSDLFALRAAGCFVKIVYSPLDAVKIAQENPDKQVVFFAIGFETTAPANAASVLQAKAMGVKNYSILSSMVRVPPAMHTILGAPHNRVQGLLAAGHVCSIMGFWEYTPIAQQFHIPITVTGLEPLDLVQGILMTLNNLEKGEAEVQNAYKRVVTKLGNRSAQEMIAKILEPCDRQWRGIGLIPLSGWNLRKEFADFDAENRFQVGHIHPRESEICCSGLMLQGLKKPPDCSAFGTLCTPEKPLGATMVSSEGVCSAYYRYARVR